MKINCNATRTASLFHHDNNFVRLLFGPVGCGKSVANCVEVFRRACQQEPDSNGIRRSRWGIIRNTYPELKSTTIKTWLDWFPEHIYGAIKRDSPITHHIGLQLEDASLVDLEVIFLALDSEQDVKKLMSFEFTGIYINELQYVHPKIFKVCQQRVNRFPPKKGGVPITWTGVIADTNPPSTRHWIYDMFERKCAENFSCYKFKPALRSVAEKPQDTPYATSRDGTIYINNVDADYINNLPDNNYYLNQVPGSTDEEIKVYMLGEYGVVIDGKPVHPEYKDRLHYANKALKADSTLEVGLGWDFGLTPACAIVQFTAHGQLIVLDELYSEDMSVEDFAENVVVPHLNRHYPFWKANYVSRHDPAGQGESQVNKRTCQQALAKNGILSQPAATTNAAVPRRTGLKYHLRRLTQGEPGFYLSNRCPQLREGLMGNYQYARVHQVEGIDTRYHEKPLKNMYSHICEALEYIAMYYARMDDKKESPQDVIVTQIAQQHAHLQKLRERSYANR